MKKILVPTDFSRNATKAVMYAAEIAKRCNATICLLHILEAVTGRIHQPYELHESLEEEIVNNRHNELAILQKSMAISYPDVKIHTEVTKGTVTNTIAEFAGKNEIDLIVMGTKGATGLKEIFMGSVATATIGSTKIPVLAIPDEYEMEVPDRIIFATNSFEENELLLNKIVDLAKLFSAVIPIALKQ
jgi:nucleotide-binding universal stress UspA family protein